MARIAAVTPAPGTLLADPSWLAQRVADTARHWRLDDDRIAATLWWYSASSVIASGTDGLLTSAGAPDTTLETLTVDIAADGRPTALHPTGRLNSPDAVAAALAETFGTIIAALPGANAQALWAVASDSLANRCLDVGGTVGSSLAVGLARLIGPPLPPPRFVDVGRDVAEADPAAPVPTGRRRLLRRTSCCLIYRSPVLAAPGDPDAAARAKCVSCPHQLRDIRAARLTAL